MCLSNYSARIRGEGRANVSLHIVGPISTFNLTDSNKVKENSLKTWEGTNLPFITRCQIHTHGFVNLCSGSAH